MKIEAFIRHLEQLNFYLVVEADKLVLKGDRKKLTTEATNAIRQDETIIGYIREHKQALIDYLRNSPPTESRKPAGNIVSIYRMSGLQEGILFHGLYDNSTGAYVQQVCCDIIGLEEKAFRESWAYLLTNHTILRSSFYYDAFKIPVQCVHQLVNMPVALSDLRALSPAEQEQQLQQYLEADRRKGFDFKVPPLMRIQLFRRSEERYTMIWTYHHLLMDGWSRPLLIREFLETYDQLILGKSPTLREEDRYEDYIRYIENTDKEQATAYWQQYLQGLEAATLLPFIRSGANRTQGVGKLQVVVLNLNAAITAQLETFTQQLRITVNTVMQGVWAFLLHRYTGNSNIAFGITVSGRPEELPGMESRVGPYINALPLHSILEEDKPIAEWLQNIQQGQLQSARYQYTPLNEIQHLSGIGGDLFDSMMNFQNFPMSKVLLQHAWQLQVAAMEVMEQTSNYPFSIRVTTSENILVEFVYKDELLDAQMVHNIRGHFEQVLLSIVTKKASILKELRLLTGEEEQQLLNSFGMSGVDYPKDKTVVHLFEEQVVNNPAALALVFEEEQLSYRQLQQRVNQLAAYLQSRGLQPEELVVISVKRSIESIIGILAILKAGGAYVPVSAEYPQDRIQFILRDTAARFCLVDPALKQRAAAFDQGVIFIDIKAQWQEISTINAPGYEKINNNVQWPVYLIYTSGSTGQPKGVIIEHRALVDHLYGVIHSTGLQRCRSFALFASLVADAGHSILFAALITGAALHILSDEQLSDGDKIQTYLQQHAIDAIKIVPSLWLSYCEDNTMPLPRKLLLFGGETFSLKIIERLLAGGYTGDVFNHYGPTEATIGKCIHQVDLQKKYQQVPIGKPFSNTKVYILNTAQQVCPVGVPGELYIGGDGLARGYLNLPELTAERFITNPFHAGDRLYRTGDLVKWLPDGEIEYLGRMDEQVKIRGYRIELGEIEQVLNQAPGIAQAVVVMREDKQGNKRLIAYLVPKNGYQKESVDTFLRTALPEYMVPAVLLTLEELPLTAIGKIDKKRLPQPADLAGEAATYTTPRNEVEEMLALIWGELLGRERISTTANFFELGGDSLLAMRMVSALRKRTGQEISVRELFDHPTIARLSVQMEQPTAGSRLPPIERHAPAAQIPLSFAQERLWFIDRLQGSEQYHLSWVFRLTGTLHPIALEAACWQIVQRHEILRTVIKEVDGIGYQQINEPGKWKMDQQQAEAIGGELPSFIEQYLRQPYDLSQDPMLRVLLVHINPTEYTLAIVIHHIAFDGWSISLMVKELVALYAAATGHQPALLPELPVQYADYASWQRKYLTGALLEKKLAYWKAQLSNIVPLALPADYPRPEVQSIAGNRVFARVNKALKEQLVELAKQEDLTLFMTLLAVFKVLLYRYSGQQHICVGAPIAGRQQQETEALIGFFVNTLPLYSKVEDDHSFQQLLQQVKQTTLQAYEHQEIPFEKIVEVVGVERDMSRNPVFQAMFTLQNRPEGGALSLGNVRLRAEGAEQNNAKCDLILTVSDTGDGFELALSYCSDLFRQETMERMLAHYTRLLQAVTNNRHLPLGKLEILLPGEVQQVTETFNDTSFVYPTQQTITALFEQQVQQAPAAIALRCGEEQLTYADLQQRSNQLANCLLATGIQPGDSIGLAAHRGAEMIIGILGILKARAIYIPFNTEYPPERIRFIIENAGITCIVTTRQMLTQLGTAIRQPTIIISETEAYPATSPTTTPSVDDAAYIMYTSGTTGYPKGILVNQRNILKLVHEPGDIRILPTDTVLQWSNYAFDGSTYEIFSSLLTGASLCLIPESAAADVFALARIIEKEKVTVIFITTALFNGLADTELQALTGLRKLLFGGEQCSPAHVRKALAALGPGKIVHVYGPTETTVYATAWPVNSIGENGVIPIGKPLTNTQALILDAHQQPVPIGVIGELYIGGDGVSMGYVNNEILTREKFVSIQGAGRWYRTSDFARWLPDGSIDFSGRIDEQVKIRGYRIELGEIENVLREAPGIVQSIVTVHEDAANNKRLIAYLLTEGALNTTAVVSYAKTKLPEYMVPVIWIPIDQLPLNANGKIDRKKLPDPNLDTISQKSYQAPGTALEKQLTLIWQGLLGLEHIGIHDNFFELGGHSLLAMRVVAAVRKKMERELKIKEVFACPTIAELAAHLENTGYNAQLLPPITRYPRNQDIPLSFAQERLWFIDRLQGSMQYHMPWVFRLTGAVNIPALESAFRLIVNRHEVLRTVIKEKEGIGYQFINAPGQWQLDLIDEAAIDTTTSLQQYLEKYMQRPYDLSKDPMLRVLLARVGAEEYKLVIVLHHIAFDGWSIAVMVKELVHGYRLLADNQQPEWEELPIQYADYASWQRHYLSGEVLEKKLAWWKQQLHGVEPLTLPTDYPRKGGAAIRGIKVYKTLGKALRNGLVTLAQQEGVTYFMVLVAIYKVLLHRYSKQEDICVGSPVAGRPQQDLEGLIGLLVNSLALRSQVQGHQPFRDLLQQVKQTTLDAYEHQDIPFEKVVEALEIKRDLNRNPIFQTLFSLQNNPASESLQLGTLGLQPDAPAKLTTLFELSLEIIESEDGLYLAFTGSADLYQPETLHRMAGHYEKLLEAILHNIDCPVNQLPLLTTTEEQQLLETFNDTAVPYARHQSIIDLFETQALQTPDAIAVCFGSTQLSYRELNELANALAGELRNKGIAGNQFIPVIMSAGIDYLVSLIAILKSGAVCVPLSDQWPLGRLQSIVDELRPAILLLDEATGFLKTGLGEKYATRTVRYTELIPVKDNQPLPMAPDALICLFYTSGSTGTPKGVAIYHKGIHNRFCWMTDYFGTSAARSVLKTTRHIFDSSLWQLLWPLIQGGKTIIPVEEQLFDVKYLANLIATHQVTTTDFVPSLFKELVETLSQQEIQAACLSLKDIIIGGEAIGVNHVNIFRQQCPDIRLTNLYGPTEASIGCIFFHIHGHHYTTIPIGRPIANTKIYILDDQLQPVPIGVPGELYISGICLAQGYTANAEATAIAFLENHFAKEAQNEYMRMYRTGDGGRWLPDGNIEYLGRTDNQVKIRGYRIELGEIEQVLQRSTGIKQALVTVTEDPLGNKRLVAYLVTDDQYNKDKLVGSLKQQLPAYMVPGILLEMPAMPLTAGGKIDRKKLPPIDELTASASMYVAPRNETEQALAGIWQQLLGIPQAGIHSDFFELGGHSLLAMRMIAAIQKQLGIDVPVKLIFQLPTIAELARALQLMLHQSREIPAHYQTIKL
jgi:amino acid adenylation domain-containing protein